MKKLTNLKGVKTLSKVEQKNINGNGYIDTCIFDIPDCPAGYTVSSISCLCVYGL